MSDTQVAPKWLAPDYDVADALKYRRPFHTFLIKVASLCNLNCAYCYVYSSPDDSFKWKPKFIETSTVELAARRIQEHAERHGLEDVTIVFHGGEPLLIGSERFEEFVRIISTTIRCKINWGLQTNGTLLNETFVRIFHQYGFRIGLSIDGAEAHNDRFRLYHNGKSSYIDVIKGLELVKSHPQWETIFGGVLIVIDLRNDPVDVLESVVGLGVKSANLLLPDAHHDAPPARTGTSGTEYGQWLYQFFRAWYQKHPELEVLFFEEIVTMMLGGISGSEELGAKSVDLIVIEANGDLEAVDTLKIVGRSATSLGLNLSNASFDDALEHPAVYSRMSGYTALCRECRKCEYLNNCGGGYIPHRYGRGNGFINPSVYCEDLKYLFKRMREDVFKP